MFSRPIRSLFAPFILILFAAACDTPIEDVEESESPPGMVQLTPEQLRTASIEVVSVELENVALPVQVPGTLVSPDTALATLGSIVEGQVGQVMAVTGDRVARGQPLLRIHSHELTDALRDRESARARLAYSRSSLERSLALLEAGAVSREEVERRQAEFDQIQAEMSRSEEWVEHLNPSSDGNVVIQAPRAGVVFRVHVGPGSAVTPGAPLIEIGETEQLWVTGFVPENAAARLTTGAPIEVAVAALPGEFVPARIVRIGGMVDPRRRAVEVRGELERVPTGALPGMFATLTLATGDEVERALLPAEAVQRTTEGELVFLEEGPGLFQAHPVRSFPLGDGRVAVEGVQQGDRIVTRGAYILRSVAEGVEIEE